MTIAEQAKLVLGALEEWTKGNGGRAFVASDVIDCIEKLRMKPGKVSASVLWQTEDVHGEYSETGKVSRGFKVVLSQGRSLKIQSGESLIEGPAGGQPMFVVAEQAREIVLGLRMDDEQGEMKLPVYKGAGPFEVNGMILDAVEVRFGLFAQNPMQAEPVWGNPNNE